MRIVVRLFAGLRERAGWSTRELADVERVADVWPALGLGDEPDGLLYAVNKEYAGRERVLADGDEVALIPPVSGGDLRLSEGPISLDEAVREVADERAGGIATFTGTTRIESRGRRVLHLDYEAYEGMAEKTMRELADALLAKYDLCGVAIHHRVGRVEIGEPSVVIAVSAPHRANALAACREAIDTLKETVPLWKSEPDRYPLPTEPLLWSGRADLFDRPAEEPSSDEREYRPIHPEPAWRGVLRKLWAPFVALGLLLWKFKFVLVAVFKFKIFTVAGSMLVSIAAYALLWGWQFAVGFVLLLLVHELGHALEAKRQGLPVSAPLFIPFLGAVIAMKQMPHDVWREARIAIAGPILGSLGAAAVWGAGEAFDSDLLIALAFVGFFLNLFNLAPVSPLDGGRIVAAIHPAIWALGLALLLALVFIAPNPILILILVIGGLEVWRRWQERKDPAVAEYYRISPGKRVAAAVGYVGLAALLAVAMSATFVDRDL